MKFNSTVLFLVAALTAEAQQVRRPTGKRRSLNTLCLGIFRDCDEDDENDSNVDGGSGSGGILDDFCLGIFRSCDGDDDVEGEAVPVDCENVTNVFGGTPLFGDCGNIATVLDEIFGGDGNYTDGDSLFNASSWEDLFDFDFSSDNSDGDGPFGLNLLPEGGFLWRIFNRDEDTSILEAILGEFRIATDSFSNGFLEDWSRSAITSNTTCNATVAEPECFDLLGEDGFWVCRTLTDPFSGEAGSKSICIGEGQYLEGNDNCGCCPGENTTAPVCPDLCGCACELQGGGDGVFVKSGLDLGDEIELPNVCVDQKWAVSMTSRFERFSCLETCPQ